MKKEGISLSKLNIFALIVTVIISIGLIIAMNKTRGIFGDTNDFTEQFLEWRKCSYELQAASDYLTDQMQNFTVTGDRTYLDNYFTEAKITKRRENALTVLGQGRARSSAYHDLSAAMEESVKLMDKEYYAARLVVMAFGYDISEYPEEIKNVVIDPSDAELPPEQMKEKARTIMHGEEYQQSKQVISNNMEKCLQELDKEMDENQSDYSAKLSRQILFEHILTVLIIIMLLLMVLYTYRLVILPLKNSVNLIRDDEDLPVSGAYEIRYLADTYNIMHHTPLKKNDKISFEDSHDKLTGLYNKAGYEHIMENMVAETTVLMLVDINKFNLINEIYGHEVGDRVLVRVSDTLYAHFRSHGYVCRIAGDVMAVILIKKDSFISEYIEEKIEEINRALGIKYDEDPVVTISTGVAYGETGTKAEDLYADAQKKLNENKENKEKKKSDKENN
ncbi:MAG: GGDEF domain-containing protein [Lachnospiraceae bacterium]|nr:GGDEF domain-containing protein [Lachnospiraceae bacterium]